ncbi:D-methionine transport system ATP-binding protein [bacterium A37T11]|nr:D-methionine transport system ATP-binding protein [bacterium A37T11]
MIHLEKITKIFRQADKDTKALDNVSIHIHPGQIFGIIGMSGAGKGKEKGCR